MLGRNQRLKSHEYLQTPSNNQFAQVKKIRLTVSIFIVLIHGGAELGAGGESTSIFIRCINVKMMSQMAHRSIMNVRTEIQGIRYAELSKMGRR
jgi:hypothetical protein